MILAAFRRSAGAEWAGFPPPAEQRRHIGRQRGGNSQLTAAVGMAQTEGLRVKRLPAEYQTPAILRCQPAVNEFEKQGIVRPVELVTDHRVSY